MKLNKKGFMLAEVVVSASVIAVILVTLYIGLNRMTSAYETRNRYYDIDAQQVAMEVNDFFKRNDVYLEKISETGNLIEISDEFSVYFSDNFYGDNGLLKKLGYSNANVYYSSFDKNNLSNLKNNTNKNTFNDYLDYLIQKTDFDENYSYFIVVELQKNNDYYYYTLKVE